MSQSYHAESLRPVRPATAGDGLEKLEASLLRA